MPGGINLRAPSGNAAGGLVKPESAFYGPEKPEGWRWLT